jgi:curved DNA-binding protein CbpA
MARLHTHYDNLKVARNAPPEVIRAAYRTLSKKYHPDHHPDNPDAMRIIQLINTAYDVLSDPVRRQEHDKWIEREESVQKTMEERVFSRSTAHRPSRSSHRTSSMHTMRTPSSRHPKLGIMHKAWLAIGQFCKGFYRKA